MNIKVPDDSNLQTGSTTITTRTIRSCDLKPLAITEMNLELFFVFPVVAGLSPLMRTSMKRTLLIPLSVALLFAGSALAQTQPAQRGPNNNAVNSSGQNNSNAPVAGRNSFTESQAKSKIEEAGYANVSALQKDDNGVWRGKASKGGSSTDVSVDFQGNVNPAN